MAMGILFSTAWFINLYSNNLVQAIYKQISFLFEKISFYCHDFILIDLLRQTIKLKKISKVVKLMNKKTLL